MGGLETIGETGLPIGVDLGAIGLGAIGAGLDIIGAGLWGMFGTEGIFMPCGILDKFKLGKFILGIFPKLGIVGVGFTAVCLILLRSSGDIIAISLPSHFQQTYP
jgi:hypothetical protein